MVCESCHSELEPVMVICPACGVRVEHGREDVPWQQQVKDTVERHKAKRRREQTKHDDEARQLSIFPASSEQDEEDRSVRARRAEIRARIEERMSKRRNTPSSPGARSHVGAVSSRGGAVAARALVRSTPNDPDDRAHQSEPVSHVESATDVAEERVLDPKTLEFAPDELAGEADLEITREAFDGPAPSAEPFIGFGLASAGERVLSGLIDLAFVSLIQLALFYLTTHLVAQRLGALPTSALVAMGLVGAVLGAGYFLFFWSLSGQTLGKLLTGGRVVDGGGGGALGVSRAALRLAGAVVSAVPLGAGFLGLWTDTDRRGWHDRLAGTKVVRG